MDSTFEASVVSPSEAAPRGTSGEESARSTAEPAADDGRTTNGRRTELRKKAATGPFGEHFHGASAGTVADIRGAVKGGRGASGEDFHGPAVVPIAEGGAPAARKGLSEVHGGWHGSVEPFPFSGGGSGEVTPRKKATVPEAPLASRSMVYRSHRYVHVVDRTWK
jgi:hypothetical protein